MASVIDWTKAYFEFKKRWEVLRRPTYKEKVDLIMEYYPPQHHIFVKQHPEENEYLKIAKEHGIRIENQILNFVNETEYQQVDELFVKNWVNLKVLFKEIGSLRKGEQHRFMKQVVDKIGKNWKDTLNHNTNQDCFKFLKILKVLNITVNYQIDKDTKFHREAQMYAVRSFMRLPQTLDNVQNAMDGMSAGVERLGNAIEGTSDILCRFNDMVKNIMDKIGNCEMNSVVMAFVKLISFSYLIMEKQNQNARSIMALLALILPMDVLGNVERMILPHLLRAVEGIRLRFAPDAETQMYKKMIGEAQMGNDESIIYAFFSLTKQLFISMASPIDSEAFRNMSLQNNKIKLLSDYLKSANTIYEYFFGMFTKLVEFFTDVAVKYYGILPSLFRNADIDELMAEYHEMVRTNVLEQCMVSASEAKRVLDFHAKVFKMESELYRKMNAQTPMSVNIKIMPYLRLMCVHLNKIVNDIPPHVKNGFEGFRKKPFWLYIHGESNVAKSSLIQPILASLLAKRLKLVDTFDDPHNYSYFRVCGAKFYAKYNKQPIIQYNDLFQNYADTESMDEAVIELTNIVDEAPYELNMPDVESKGKVFCVSQIVMSNAQNDIVDQGWLGDRCWSGGVHLYRRRNLVLQPKINAKYRYANGNPGIDWNLVNAAVAGGSPVSKYVKFVPLDLYYFVFTHPVTAIVIKRVDIDVGIDFILKSAEDYFNGVDDFHKKLVDQMRDNWAQMDNFEDSQCDCVASWYEDVCNHPMMMEDRFFRAYVNDYIQRTHRSLCARASGFARGSEQYEKFIVDILLNCIYENYVVNKKNVKKMSCYLFKLGEIALKVKSQIIEYLKSISIVKVLGVCAVVLGAAKMILSFVKPKAEAQSHEGNAKAKKLRIKRKVKVRGHVSGNAQYDDTNAVVENCCADNFCTFTIFIADNVNDVMSESSMYMNSICVGGSVFVIPRHFWLVIKQAQELVKKKDKNLILQLKWKNQNQTVIPWTNVDVYYPDQDYLVDIAFLRIRTFTSKRDIRHFFVKEDDDLLFHEAYLYGLRSKRLQSSELSVISVDGVKLMSSDYRMASMSIDDCGHTEELTIQTPVVYEYFNCKTISGDCGAILMFVNSKLNNRVMAGIHVGGTPSNASGFAAPLFQEDINEAFEYFNSEIIEITRRQPELIEVMCQMDTEESKQLKGLGANVIGQFKTMANGKRMYCTLPQKTKIVESCVHDMMLRDFGPNKMAPARLRPFVLDGLKLSPFYKAYRKMLKYPPVHIPYEMQNELVNCVFVDIMAAKSVYSTRNCDIKILDDLEMVNGIVGLKQLDLSTSPGFPYIFQSPGNGKRPWFKLIERAATGQPIFVMTSELKKEVDLMEQDAKDGIMSEIYFVDTMKDETRVISKVNEGKTRIFQVGPMSLTLLVRKYFGCFIAHLSMTFIEGESAIGIDCNSPDWHRICKSMFAFSEEQLVGDFSDYDASILCEFAEMFADLANKFYDEKERSVILLRRVLCKMCVQAYHVVGGTICDFDSIMNSGIAITAHLNTVVNMFLFRLAFRKLTKLEFCDFRKYVKSKFYGDDNWLSVLPCIIDKFNMLTIQRFFVSLGYKYTSVVKGEISVPSVKWNEISFLKRGVQFREDLGIFVSLLDRDVVYEIPRWSEGDPRNMSDQMQRFNAVLSELANYSKEEFMECKKRFIRYCIDLSADYHDISANDLCSYSQVLSRNYGGVTSVPIFLKMLE